jgi:hypothetical protein
LRYTKVARRYGAETAVLDWRERLVCSHRGSHEVEMIVTGTEHRCPGRVGSILATLSGRLAPYRAIQLKLPLRRILSDIPRISGLLGMMFRLIEARRNAIRSQPHLFAAKSSGRPPRSGGTRCFASIKAQLCRRRLWHLPPSNLPVMLVPAVLAVGR